MEPDVPTSPEREAMWRGNLLGTDPRYRQRHRLSSRLPADPRCKVCSVPFGGPIGRALRTQVRGRVEPVDVAVVAVGGAGVPVTS